MIGRVFFIVALLCPLGAGLFRVWVYQDAVQSGYELSAEVRRQERLRNELKSFRVELAVLKSPERLHRYAEQLGLRPPGAGQVCRQTGGERP